MAPAITNSPALDTTTQTQEIHSVPSSLSLSGKTIVVTGGGRGLGISLAHGIVESGGHVVCLDILETPSEPGWSTLLKLCKGFNTSASFYRCDITDESNMAKTLTTIAKEAKDRGAPFSGIVACAGIQQKVPGLEYGPADFEKILHVNVTGTFITAKWAARLMVESKQGGSIVLVASMSGQIANRGLTCSAYNSSKSAVHQMSRSLAQEWGQYGIRINTISPGYVLTDMTNALLETEPEVHKKFMAGALLGRLGEPEDFKAPTVFLLSGGSSFVTGIDLRVDGGHCAAA